jgi:sugar/nucleoside kinase (ribokinase family)
VVGSANVDTILSVHHLPSSGENLTLLPNYEPIVDVPGGKGCNQAIASSKLQSLMHHDKGGGGDGAVVSFIGQFGNDESTSSILRNALIKHNVDISHSGQSKAYPCGRGYVILVPNTGEVCAIVSGGSNLFGWDGWSPCDDDNDNDEEKQHNIISDDYIRNIVTSYKLLLLQCEIPSFINLRLANIAHELDIPVILDAGGEDRFIEKELLDCVDYFIPNETELSRLVKHYNNNDDDDDDGSLLHHEMMSTQEVQDIQNQIGPTIQLQSLLKSVRMLQRNGASNVLVTLGSHGSILVKDCKKEKTQHQQLVTSSSSHCRNIIYQPSCPLLSLGLSVVDETGAGDCYRAGFAVALLEYCKLGSRGVDYDDGDVDDDGVLEQCMKFASAAGALAVTKSGAVPSIPTREEVDELLLKWSSFSSSVMTKKEVEEEHSSIMMVDNVVPRGGSDSTDEDESFPFLFGSRLNSMKDRTDLLSSSLPLSHPRDYVRRQATIRGLGCVDFNYPQHFEGYWSPEDAKVALDEVGLIAGAVCLRYPAKFARGAMNHPVASMRREAIEITKGAAEAARKLGCNE